MQTGTVLIVDDNKSVLTSLELLLEDEFERVETASNPNSILSVLDTMPVDLVILDMNFLRRRKHRKRRPVLATPYPGNSPRTAGHHAYRLRRCGTSCQSLEKRSR